MKKLIILTIILTVLTQSIVPGYALRPVSTSLQNGQELDEVILDPDKAESSRSSSAGEDYEEANRHQSLSRPSADDKHRVLDKGINGRRLDILQVGLWDEAITEYLRMHYPGARIIGLDNNPAYLGAASKKYPGYEFLLRNIVNWPDYYQYEGRFDVIVLGSTLHAVYFREGPAMARQALELIAGLLKPGGRLIIRDGLRPSAKVRTIKLKNEEIKKRFIQFVHDFKGNRDRVTQAVELVTVYSVYDGGKIDDIETYLSENSSVRIRAEDLYEFLVKYLYYGTETWQHEMISPHGCISEDEYMDFLKEHFSVINKEIYRLEYLETRWHKDIALPDRVEFPQSHIALTLEKKKAQPRRGISDFTQKADFVVIGSGIAGLRAALRLSKYGKVILITKGKLRQANTEYAQGGIAAAIDDEDTFELHIEDTHRVGAGLTEEEPVRILVTEGRDRVEELIDMDVPFDRDENGNLSLAQEGGHSRKRVLRAGGDATGREIERTLAEHVRKNKKITVFEETFVTDIIKNDGVAYGAKAVLFSTGQEIDFIAPATLIATGGYSQVYRNTSNPASATGDLIAVAYRAGVSVEDMEEVQFHPSTLVVPEERRIQNPLIPFLPQNFLVSEAVRGAGAKLLNIHGERFMLKYADRPELPEDLPPELLPRDVVARAIFKEMQKTNSDYVFLDVSDLHDEETKKPITFKERFPTIYARCLEMGLDLTREHLIPVAPAAHYCMGGIKINVNGETDIKGLYAAGEVSRVGIHGGNRLASNSLLEGLVFGYRAAESMAGYAPSVDMTQVDIESFGLKPGERVLATSSEAKEDMRRMIEIDKRMRQIMSNNVAITRNRNSLLETLDELKGLREELERADFKDCVAKRILEGKLLVARLVTVGALTRRESRGAHSRSDYPESDDINWKRGNIQKMRVFAVIDAAA